MRAMRLEGWLDGAAGAILLVGCLGSLFAVTRAFQAPLVEHVRKHDVGIVCTTGAGQALEPLCEVQQIMPCSCVSLIAPDRPELRLALSRPEPTSRTGWLNYMETIRLEARPRRPAITPSAVLL